VADDDVAIRAVARSASVLIRSRPRGNVEAERLNGEKKKKKCFLVTRSLAPGSIRDRRGRFLLPPEEAERNVDRARSDARFGHSASDPRFNSALVVMAKLHSPRTSTYEISALAHAYDTQSSVVKGTECLPIEIHIARYNVRGNRVYTS